ncbi:hypothetical protein MOO46_04500 [Apilactobacillus apisilvae]|uniref:Uncharacterized protein n=1 Tax=Apilactobacillus apisilvae TaxID=2923364 RepID=A0ABY4PFU6_9LACO|nr:hypothetical protein [Apilactobacillus apisilvae]UQS84520.1 hypothetical protein MOO46_04500 [Apilactobacillus apisilvae]
MRKHNQHINELSDSNLSKKDLNKKAIEYDIEDLKRMIHETQGKHQELYVARLDDENINNLISYDDYLIEFVNDYAKSFDQIRTGAKNHFHQEMTAGYFIDECIALLHRKFENHQDKNSMVTVDKDGKVI